MTLAELLARLFAFFFTNRTRMEQALASATEDQARDENRVPLNGKLQEQITAMKARVEEQAKVIEMLRTRQYSRSEACRCSEAIALYINTASEPAQNDESTSEHSGPPAEPRESPGYLYESPTGRCCSEDSDNELVVLATSPSPVRSTTAADPAERASGFLPPSAIKSPKEEENEHPTTSDTQETAVCSTPPDSHAYSLLNQVKLGKLASTALSTSAVFQAHSEQLSPEAQEDATSLVKLRRHALRVPKFVKQSDSVLVPAILSDQTLRELQALHKTTRLFDYVRSVSVEAFPLPAAGEDELACAEDDDTLVEESVPDQLVQYYSNQTQNVEPTKPTLSVPANYVYADDLPQEVKPTQAGPRTRNQKKKDKKKAKREADKFRDAGNIFSGLAAQEV